MTNYKKQNVVLIGFMGSGKTSVGRSLARLLRWPFIDTDQEIEAMTGMNISEIFSRYGETRFRSEETLAAQKLANLSNLVISTGGGFVLNPDNLNVLRSSSVVIGLTGSLSEIWRRVNLRPGKRPLLKTENPMETLRKLYHERDPLYRAQADFIIDTTDKTINEITWDILERLYVMGVIVKMPQRLAKQREENSCENLQC